MADKRQEHLDQLDALLTEQEKEVREAFFAFVVIVRSEAVSEQIIARLAARDLDGAMAIVDSYVARMADVIPRVYNQVGVKAAEELTSLMTEVSAASNSSRAITVIEPGATPSAPRTSTAPRLPSPASGGAGATGGTVPDLPSPKAPVGISFDPTHPRAAELIRQHRLEFIDDFSAKQKTAIQRVISQALIDGKHPVQAAREFVDVIGLTDYQNGIVNKYRRALEGNSSRALGYELRDAGRDKIVERAIANKKPLTPKQIDSLVERYRRNFLNMRAETIARTEAHDAFSAAREESVQQMMEQAGLTDDEVTRIWNSTRDLRTRDWHRTMDGQERKVGVPFEDGLGNKLMRPGDPNAPGESRINCRCATTVKITLANG